MRVVSVPNEHMSFTKRVEVAASTQNGPELVLVVYRSANLRHAGTFFARQRDSEERKEDAIVLRHVEHVFELGTPEQVEFLGAPLRERCPKCIICLLREVRGSRKNVPVRRVTHLDGVRD